MTLKEKVDSENLRKIKVKDSLTNLEPTAIIELFELYFSVNSEPFRFHAGTNNLKEIVWNSNKYYPLAIDTDDFESNMTGKLPRPKISISNNENIFSSLLKDYSDLRDSKITRRKILARHLDAINFDESINPSGTSDSSIYISYETFLISQKLVENKNFIQFELISPFDLQSLNSMNRSIIGKYCFWQYRGLGCGYSGDLVCQENDKDFGLFSMQHIKNSDGITFKTRSGSTVSNFKQCADSFKWLEKFAYNIGDIVSIENVDLNGYKDPRYTWFVCVKGHISSYFLQPENNPEYWLKDSCSKTISACKKRFLSKFSRDSYGYEFINDSLITKNALKFGGFPGTEQFKYE
jgi:lambda family phage minor tail protein L